MPGKDRAEQDQARPARALWTRILAIVIATLASALLIFAGRAMYLYATDGRLIRALGGSTREEIRQSVTLDQWTALGRSEAATLDRTTRAKKDGLLVVRSGGEGRVPGFWVCTHETEAGLNPLSDCRRGIRDAPCSRGMPYQGATLPVKSGHYYRICVRRDQDGRPTGILDNLRADWIPLVLVSQQRSALTDPR